VLTGGGAFHQNSGKENGYYIEPTILKGHNKMRVFQEEIWTKFNVGWGRGGRCKNRCEKERVGEGRCVSEGGWEPEDGVGRVGRWWEEDRKLYWVGVKKVNGGRCEV
jgi:hypothetical protein